MANAPPSSVVRLTLKFPNETVCGLNGLPDG